ncbi:hypothetical protein [Pedobacter aquatilis]|uniref:hypothetical protein n=1 Tax=Pedobacter aquatilis TaxID=351343 RepID=UPI0029318C6E|nr:hypothetical protein [Pedobacter aquatilis]
MKNQQTINATKQRVTIILSVIAIILSIPLIAMQFTNEVKWTIADFIAAGSLLLITALAIEIVIRNVKTITLRNILFAVILLILFLVWAEMAVGIFGSPIAGS